jgi:hypothetical protein
MIHEEICTYEVAKLAKEKGFDVQTFDWYDYTGNYHKGFIPHELHECPRYKEYYAPTQSLLQRWLREERGIIVEVFMDDDSNMPLTYNIHQYKDWNWECVCHHHGNYYAINDWELCLEDALKYALENLV